MNQIEYLYYSEDDETVPKCHKKMQKFNLKTVLFDFPSPKLAKAHNPIIYLKQIGKDEQIFSLYCLFLFGLKRRVGIQF